jgi:glucose/arabinose dehydrogenase
MRKNQLSIILAVFVIFITFFLNTSLVSASPQDLPSGFNATVLIDYNMVAPTGVKVAPDGRIFVFDLFGTIKIFNEGSGFLAVPFGSIAVNASGDRGLLGATFDTDFANHPYIYIHYVGTDSKVRIGRFDASQNVGTNFTELYVSPLASGGQHAGGGIAMDKNGYIFFGIGDSGTPTNSQDLTTPHGKIHRIYRDGSVPTNPFAGQVGVPSTIYAYGVRNPFRMTMDKLSGVVYVGDVGYNTWEEVNLIEPGKNYGWATQEGPCASTCPYQNPVYWYAHQFGSSNTNDASIVLGPVYRGSLYPASYYGKAFVSDYVQGFMRTINPAITSSSSAVLSNNNGAVIDMDIAPNGKLYFVTISSPKLYRLDYTGGVVNQPPLAVATSSITTGPSPLSVNFSSTGSNDPEGAALTYLWDFGDNSTSSTANPVKVYSQDGQYTARLTVSDGVSSVLSDTITISVGSAPTLNINLPLGTALYVAGETITYSVTANDSDGQPLASSSISTMVRLHHSDHSHPFAGPFFGNSGQVTTPIDGELSPDVWLRFIFDAVGSNGVRTTKTVDVYPQLSQITVNTSPAGLNVVLDGSNHVIPPTIQGVIGMNRQVAAPSPQMFGDTQYVFDYWSDGGTQDHTFTFPATTTVYTAYYRAVVSTSTPINLVENGSFENEGNLPSNWRFSRWGNNNISATLSNDSSAGLWSLKMESTQITSGEGRIYHNPVAASSTTVYGVKYYRKNDVLIKAVADVTLTDNSHRYIWLGISQPSATWLEQNWTFTTPANTKNVVVNLYHTSNGTIQIDDFSLFDPLNVSVPVIVAPDLNLSAASTSISEGATTTLNWTAFGTLPTCVAYLGWQGLQPISGQLEIAPTSTQSYVLTCTNQAGTSTKSVTIEVTGHEHHEESTSLITNPSAELHDAFDNPIDWTPTRWGTNDAVLEHEHGDAYEGNHSLTTIIANHTSGEAGWVTAPISIEPLTAYIFSEYTKSTGPTKVQVEVTLVNGSKKYLWLGRLQNSDDWSPFTKEFTTPAEAKTIKIGTYLTGIGSLNMDQIELEPKIPPVPPEIDFSVDDNTLRIDEITTLRWSVTGGSPTCVGSEGWTGTKPSTGTEQISVATSTVFTLTCENQFGTSTKSITVDMEIVVPPPPTNENLITINTDFGESNPSGWIKGSWGNNTNEFGVATSGHTDNSSLQVSMSDYIDGDAKWFFEPVSVTGNTSYTYSNWYRTEAQSRLVAEYTLSGGSKAHEWLGSVGASTDWNQKSVTIQTPVDAIKVTVHHVLTENGVLETDDFSLIQN